MCVLLLGCSRKTKSRCEKRTLKRHWGQNIRRFASFTTGCSTIRIVVYITRNSFMFSHCQSSKSILVGFTNCEKRLLASSCLSVRPFAGKQLDSHWTDFHELWYLIIFRNTVGNIQVSLKSYKNNGHFTWRPIYIFIVSRAVLRMRNVSDKRSGENQITRFMFNNSFL